MSIPSNPVTIGSPTKKSNYDALYDNCILADTGGTAGGAQSVPGVKTFSDGIKADDIEEASTGHGVDIEGVVCEGSAVTAKRRLTGQHVQYDDTVAERTLFSALSTHIPNVGDSIVLYGWYHNRDRILHFARRTSSNLIVMYHQDTVTGMILGEVDYTDSSTTFGSGCDFYW